MLDRRTFLRFRQPPAPRAGAPLAPYVPSDEAPWGPERARHLLRRTGVGARPDDVRAVLTRTPAEAVDRIVKAAANRALLPEPEWIDRRKPKANAPYAERAAFNEWNDQAIADFYRAVCSRLIGNGDSGRFRRLGEALRERMTVFWSNHFVADLRTHTIAVWLFHYRQTLRRHALGDFRQFVHDIGLTPSMLDYLDGNQNRAGAPNENYARELLELFTMGVTGPDGSPNYTQADIAELARALTGWRTYKHLDTSVAFEPDQFDDGPKTIFGRTAAFGYDDVVPLLFEARSGQIAHFVADGLYREFVRNEPDPAVVAALAQRLLDEDFQIKPVLIELLGSAHFFDQAHIGALIRSPIELMLGSAYEFGLDEVKPDDTRFRYKAAKVGQDLFNPPDVRGWEGGRAWIDTGSLGARVKAGNDEFTYAPEAFALGLLTRPEARNARTLVAALCQEHLAWPLSEDEIDDLTEELLAGTPPYAWDPTADIAGRRVREFMHHLISLPAYQLR